jgi:hypothetical protein
MQREQRRFLQSRSGADAERGEGGFLKREMRTMLQTRLGGGWFLACGAAAVFLAVGASAQPVDIPDLQSGQAAWLHPPGGAFPAVEGSPMPVGQDPAHPYVGNGGGGQPTFRIGDVSNPNLLPWAKEAMEKDNAEVLGGKIAFTARSSCLPAGTPVFTLFGGQPIFFIQTADKVLILYEGDHQVRHVYLNVPHSQNPKPSWYGESVGHYEDGVLVVDTIAQNTKTVVDAFRTPHTEKMHVVERYRLTDGGKGLEVGITVDDPDTFHQPWQTYQRYRRGAQTMEEEACAENQRKEFWPGHDIHYPIDNTPDF